MTIQEVRNMTIGLTEEGLPCLCKKTRSGKVSVVRVITAEETAALCGVLYALHKRVHPGEEVMVLPYGKGSALAVKEVCLSDGVEAATNKATAPGAVEQDME